MKKWIFLTIFLILIINSFSIVESAPEIKPQSATIKINVQASQLDKEEVIGNDGRTYYKLSIPESDYLTQEEGSPQLPFIRKLIQIPDQAYDIELHVSYQAEAIEYNDILVYPSPKLVVNETPKGFQYIAEEFYIDENIYQQDLFMPVEIAEIKEDGYLRSVRILEVFIYPVVYNPQQKILRFYPSIELDVSYKLDWKIKTKIDTTQHFKSLIKDLVVETTIEGVEMEATGGSVVYLTASDLRDTSNQIDYLIITHSDFYSSTQLQDLAQYRANYDSFNIGIAQVQDIYTEFLNPSGNDYSIKDFVQYAYDNWQTAPSYLLLLGDVEWVPSHLDAVGVGNADNDDWFGYVSGEDEWADLAIGRLSVRTTADIGYIKDKIYSYEQDTIVSGDYHERAAFMEGHYVSALRDTKSMLTRFGYDVTALHGPDEYCINSVCTNFSSNFIYIHAHGNYDVIGVNYCDPDVMIGWDPSSACDEQRPPDCEMEDMWPGCGCCCVDCTPTWNYEQYPIVMTLSCGTADISVTDCLGEKLVRQQDKGAVAYYGSTVLVEDNYVSEYTLDEIFDGFNYYLGQAVAFAEIKNLWPSHAQSQILIGDPALHAFGHRLSQTQPDLTLASTDVSYNGRTDTLSVNITNLGNVDATNIPVKVVLYETSEIIHDFADFTVPLMPAQSEVKTNINVPPPLRGEYLVIVKIDHDNIIEESFDLNNQNGREIDTRSYSKVTVLDENDQPISGIAVRAYSVNDVQLDAKITDAQGNVKFYNLAEGIQVYFQVTFYGDSARSYVLSDTVTTHTYVIINKPAQTSSLTVLNEGQLVTHYRVWPYDMGGRKLGFSSFYDPAEEEVFDFYITEGVEFYFKVLILDSSIHDPGTEIYSDNLIAPANAIIVLNCIDSDGGFEPEVKGTVSGYQDGEYYSYTDYCGGGTYINEYFCNDSGWQVEPYDCRNLGSRYYCSSTEKICKYKPPPGGGCPILKVYNGNEFVTIEKLDIHAPEYQDKIVTTSFTMKSINGKYEIILDEAAYIPLDGSHIDYVKLIDESGKECELLSAVHSKHGDVLLELIKSDDVRIQTFPSENIKLAYTCSGNRFEFIIEGYNPLRPPLKTPYFTLSYLLEVTIPIVSIILIAIEIIVIALIVTKLTKRR